MKAYGGVDVHIFLTSALVGGEGITIKMVGMQAEIEPSNSIIQSSNDVQ
jgi:hypothetical protein